MRRATRNTLLLLALAVPTARAVAAECGGSIPCGCGDTVTGHAVLREDLGPCDANGLVLNGDAVLDCAGHWIRAAERPPEPRRTEPRPGEPSRAAATFGVILDRTRGALVRNCKITGFSYGVEFSGARDSRLVGSEVWKNGDFKTNVGYGVHLSRSQGNTVETCTVHESADEGIHIGSGSDRNVVTGNEAYDNTRENYYVLSARGNRLVRNRGRGAVSANLYMKHAIETVVEGNQFESRPVVVRGRSVRNVFADNVLGGGVKLEAYGEAEAEVPTENVVRGGRILGSGPCVELTGARQNRLEALRLEGCRGIVARARGAAVNDVVAFDVAGVRLDLSGGAVLRLLTPLRVEVRGPRGEAVPDARVEAVDRSGEVLATGRTDRTGVAALDVPMHSVNAAGLVPLPPPTLVATAEGVGSGRLALSDPPPPRPTVRLGTADASAPSAPSTKRGPTRPAPPKKSAPRPTSVP